MRSPKTTLEQYSTVTDLPTGSQRFNVQSTITFVREGDLPHPDIFVHQIVVPTNPKDDKFLRVCRIYDLTTIVRGREQALQTNQPLYLSASSTITFDKLNVAVEAKKVVQTRVDALIDDWHTYTEQFVNPDEFEFPSVDPTLVKAATAAYKTAKENRITKDAALSAANVALSTTQDSATLAASNLTDRTARQVRCAQMLSLLGTAISAETTFRTASSTFLTASQTFLAVADDTAPSSDVATYQANISAYQSALLAEGQNGGPTLASLQTALSTECANELADVNAAATAKINADAAVASAQTSVTIAQAEATQAATQESAALAAVLELCPDFDPDSV